LCDELTVLYDQRVLKAQSKARSRRRNGELGEPSDSTPSSVIDTTLEKANEDGQDIMASSKDAEWTVVKRIHRRSRGRHLEGNRRKSSPMRRCLSHQIVDGKGARSRLQNRELTFESKRTTRTRASKRD
jgi:hypothetical protein